MPAEAQPQGTELTMRMRNALLAGAALIALSSVASSQPAQYFGHQVIGSLNGTEIIGPVRRSVNGTWSDWSISIATMLSGLEQQTNKGAPNGYAPLNGSSQVPAVNLGFGTTTGTVADGGALAATTAIANAAIPSSTLGAANGPAMLNSLRQVEGDGSILQVTPFTAAGSVSSPGTVPVDLANLFGLTPNAGYWGIDPSGATDSTAALQLALDSYPYGGEIALPLGTIKVSSLTVPAGMCLRGQGGAATNIETTSATANVLTFNGPGGCVKDLGFSSIPTRTAGSYIYSAYNVKVTDVIASGAFLVGQFIGTSNTSLVVEPEVLRLHSFNPAVGAGSGLLVFENFSSFVVDGVQGAGPASGQQPDFGIKVQNGDTGVISNSNITLYGSTLAITPQANENTYAISLSNDTFDSGGLTSSGNAPSCLIQPAGNGNVYEVKATNFWCGLSKVDGLLVQATGGGHVDGLHIANIEAEGNAGNGVHVGAGVIHMGIFGGIAAGNTSNGVYISGASTQLKFIGLDLGTIGDRGANGQYGINIGSGSGADYITADDNQLCGNTTGSLFNGSSGTHNVLHDNACYNPVGASLATVGASGTTYTAGSSPETDYINGGSGLSVMQGGQTLATGSGPIVVNLAPNEQYALSYATAPSSIARVVH